LSGAKLEFSPEECSAEILKVLFGYLPEEIRNDPDLGTVITVPAAFNQMQKDATMQAADFAGIGKVALIQEPVAAVMSVMKNRNTDGIFLIYDLGGGTLDVAIAESINNRVSLLANGGIAWCGGRDFDRKLFDNVVKPWLLGNYDLPDDLSINPNYTNLMRLAVWATERAKTELSFREEAIISLSETESGVRDLSGEEIYIEIPLERSLVDRLIADKVDESIQAAREVLDQALLSPHDVERIVFIGGPTNYKPLRDKVSLELAIPASTETNPMVAVAEGASIFAESIDWQSKKRSRKGTRGQLTSIGHISISFNYISRTPDIKSKIGVLISGQILPGCEFEIISLDTGWTSGRKALEDGMTVDVSLDQLGDNVFRVLAYDSKGGPISLEMDRIIICKTAATISGIPASHSIGVEVLNKLGGMPVLDWIVRSGDPLPHKGSKVFKAGESLKAGSAKSFNFRLWEGDIEDPITDNRPIGLIKLAGTDFEEGVIPAGADLICEYEVLDSGNIIIVISVPFIGATFDSHNFYSRQENEPNFGEECWNVIEEGSRTQQRLVDIEKQVNDPKLNRVKDKIETAIRLNPEEQDIETIQEAMENVYQARRILAQVKKEHIKDIWQIDLDNVSSFFNKYLREQAKPAEENAFDNLVRTAQKAIDNNLKEFEQHLVQLRNKNWDILWRQDWFVIEQFKSMASEEHMFANKAQFEELVSLGKQLLKSGDIDKLRIVTAQLGYYRIRLWTEDDLLEIVNIIRS
jgi:molecular chaperone DnaK